MKHLLLGAISSILVVAFISPNSSSAKGAAFLLTGGQLGSHAYLLTEFIPDAEGQEWIPAASGVKVERPAAIPSLAYGLYRRSGVFAMTAREPEMRYYPTASLIHELQPDTWYAPPPEAVTFLNRTIDDALAAMERGELDDNALVADLRDRQMDDVQYSLWPFQPGVGARGSDIEDCESCLGYVPDAQAFALEDLVETVSQPSIEGDYHVPIYTIEYHGWWGQGGIGGILGYYSPPDDFGLPGRFWTDSYFYDQAAPYYETTPGFDASIEAALSSQPGVAEAELAGQLNNMRLPQATFVLHPYAVPGVGYNLASDVCPDCLLLSGPNEAFVMDDLFEVLTGPEVGSAPEMPAYAIEYAVPNQSGDPIRQLLGMYRPPEDGASGQFWFMRYSRATPYRETTPAFDAVVASAIERAEPWGEPVPKAPAATEAQSDSTQFWLWMGLLAAGALVLGGAGALTWRLARS